MKKVWLQFTAGTCLVAGLILGTGAVPVFAAEPAPASADSIERQADVPKELQEVGLKEHLGSSVSIQSLKFRDEAGLPVTLSDYFHKGRPVLLTIVYYECPNLCNFVLNGLVNSLRNMDWTPGNQFDVVAVSMDPREGPDLAARKKAAYVASYHKPLTAPGWHFLTADPALNTAAARRSDPPTNSAITQLAQEVGFGYKWAGNEYAHGAAIYVLTPEGKISRYLYGIEFPETSLRLSLVEASSGKIGSIVDRVLLFCYHYDPETRKYSLVVTRVMRLGSGAMVLLVGLGFLVAFRREKRRFAVSLNADLEPASQNKGV